MWYELAKYLKVTGAVIAVVVIVPVALFAATFLFAALVRLVQ
jgi:hypothetical protein